MLNCVKMQDQIIFLGTGGDPVVVGKQIRSSGGIVLKLDGLQFHLDPGPGALVKCTKPSSACDI